MVVHEWRRRTVYPFMIQSHRCEWWFTTIRAVIRWMAIEKKIIFENPYCLVREGDVILTRSVKSYALPKRLLVHRLPNSTYVVALPNKVWAYRKRGTDKKAMVIAPHCRFDDGLCHVKTEVDVEKLRVAFSAKRIDVSLTILKGLQQSGWPKDEI